MQNVADNAAVTAAATLAAASIEAEAGMQPQTDAATGTAVLDAPADQIVEQGQATDQPAQPEGGEEVTDQPANQKPADPLAEVYALIAGKTVVEYTRPELLDARTFTLLVKRSAKQAGFGEKVGPMLRDTLGYKFDGMDIMEMLREMAKPDFLDRYKATCERWYAGLNKSASEATLKSNKAKFDAAMALFSDRVAYARLVKSLLILCQRNQSWMEAGSNVALPYNGHKAVLDLFGVNVTNSRRLKLTAN